MTILEAKRVGKQFAVKDSASLWKKKVFQALENVDLRLDSGRTVGVVGESGSGKSTLGEILGDLQRPSAGTVLYKGRDVRSLTKAKYRQFRRNVQYIFQNPKESMNPYFTVEKILTEPMQVLLDSYDAASARRRAAEMLGRVGLAESALGKYPSELSGGQCQRIAIARALLLSPEVIVCDECVSALDVSIQSQILNLLKDLQREFGTAYLFISHDIGVIHYMSDEIIVVNHGHVVEQGEGAAVIRAPKDDYTRTLIASAFFTGEAARCGAL